MVGKVVKDGNEVWVEVLPAEDYYRLTEVIKGVMKQDITATDMLKTNIPDSHKALPVDDINLTKPMYQREVKRDGNEMEVEVLPDEVHDRLNEVKDFDGNVYKTITIGTQVWMAENLKTTHGRIGQHIPLVTDNYIWYNITIPGYCWYNNDEAAYKNTYGALYNYYAVITQDLLCPVGWRLPTPYDWTTLADYLGGINVAGGKLKETSTVHWASPNTGATNETGFTALPGGGRVGSNFSNIGKYSFWWTLKDFGTSIFYGVQYDNSKLATNYYDKSYGLSVRCIKSSQP